MKTVQDYEIAEAVERFTSKVDKLIPSSRRDETVNTVIQSLVDEINRARVDLEIADRLNLIAEASESIHFHFDIIDDLRRVQVAKP